MINRNYFQTKKEYRNLSTGFMKKIFILSVFFVFSLSAMSLRAQHSLLSWQQCLQQAKQHSFLVQSGQSQITVARQMALLKKAQAIPKISGELAGEGHFLGGYNFGQEWALVQADWSLGDFLKKTNRAARQDVITRRFLVKQQELEAMGNAAVLYIAILQTQKALQLLNIQLRLMQKHKMLTTSMWKAGLRTQLDVLQTQTQMATFREDSVKLLMQTENLRHTLAMRLGWPSGDSLQIAPIATGTSRKLILPVQATALAGQNPMVRVLQSKIAAQRLRTQNAAAYRYPHISLGGGWFADGDPTGDGNYWLIRAGIRMPIYEGKSIKTLETASVAQKESLQYQLQHVRRETMIKINRLTEKMKRLLDMMKIQKQRIETLKKSAQFAETNFKAGLITNLEYLDIRHKLTDAQLKLEQSRLSFALNLIDYYVVTGQTGKLMALGE